jgi:hypothetical protein
VSEIQIEFIKTSKKFKPKMKNLKKLSVITTLALGFLFINTSCQKEEIFEEIAPTTNKTAASHAKSNAEPVFDATQFGKLIENYLDGKVAGYGYNVIHDGQLAAFGGKGWSRKWYETNPTKHNFNQAQGIASSTKFVTALATIAILEKYGLTLDSYVFPYLPVTWQPSDAFRKVTFRHLLAHKAGLIDNGGTWAGYEKTVEGPLNVVDFEAGKRVYDNLNYSLVAIILPYVEFKKNKTFTFDQMKALEYSNTWYSASSLGLYFRNIVRKYVFKPANLMHWSIVDWTCWNSNGVIPAEQGTKGYQTPYGNETGNLKADTRLNGGSGGLYISTFDFGKIQMAAKKGQLILPANYLRMQNELLGFDGAVNGKFGKYYWKNGASNNHETIIFDTGRTQIAIFANSQASDIGGDRAIVRDAYDAAWSN